MANWKNNKMVGVVAAVIAVISISFVIFNLTKDARRSAQSSGDAAEMAIPE